MKTKNQPKILGFFSKAGTNLSLIIALLVMGIVFSVMSEHFFTARNLVNIATYTSINAIMAFGVTVALILASMDLSQFAVAAFASMVAAVMIQNGSPVGLAVLVALLLGGLLGLINGVIVSFFGVNAIIATLGTQQVFRGCAYLNRRQENSDQ